MNHAITRPPREVTAGMSPELGKIITTTTELLHGPNPQKALDFLHSVRLNSPWVANAIAVCQLRLGKPQSAIDIYRSMLLSGSGITLRRDAPSVFKTNYAIALLLNNNVSGCMSILRDLNQEDHPAVNRLQGAISHWVSRLSFWQKLGWYLGSEVKSPVQLDFPPGDLQ